MSITVLIVDDHSIVSDGLELILETSDDIHVVGQARDGRDAIRMAVELQPDIILMDVSMPRLNGVEATEIIRKRCPASKVLILSMHADEEYVVRSLQTGARGYILKASAGSEVIDAIHSVKEGKRFLSRKIDEERIDERLLKGSDVQPLDTLSRREREVLQLIAEGGSVAQIATELSLSPKTVETYRSRLMQKLHIHDIQGLVKFAIQHGITALE